MRILKGSRLLPEAAFMVSVGRRSLDTKGWSQVVSCFDWQAWVIYVSLWTLACPISWYFRFYSYLCLIILSHKMVNRRFSSKVHLEVTVYFIGDTPKTNYVRSISYLPYLKREFWWFAKGRETYLEWVGVLVGLKVARWTVRRKGHTCAWHIPVKSFRLPSTLILKEYM